MEERDDELLRLRESLAFYRRVDERVSPRAEDDRVSPRAENLHRAVSQITVAEELCATVKEQVVPDVVTMTQVVSDVVTMKQVVELEAAARALGAAVRAREARLVELEALVGTHVARILELEEVAATVPQKDARIKELEHQGTVQACRIAELEARSPASRESLVQKATDGRKTHLENMESADIAAADVAAGGGSNAVGVSLFSAETRFSGTATGVIRALSYGPQVLPSRHTMPDRHGVAALAAAIAAAVQPPATVQGETLQSSPASTSLRNTLPASLAVAARCRSTAAAIGQVSPSVTVLTAASPRLSAPGSARDGIPPRQRALSPMCVGLPQHALSPAPDRRRARSPGPASFRTPCVMPPDAVIPCATAVSQRGPGSPLRGLGAPIGSALVIGTPRAGVGGSLLVPGGGGSAHWQTPHTGGSMCVIPGNVSCGFPISCSVVAAPANGPGGGPGASAPGGDGCGSVLVAPGRASIAQPAIGAMHRVILR